MLNCITLFVNIIHDEDIGISTAFQNFPAFRIGFGVMEWKEQSC
ncbi:hypothetical protein TREVI0001_0200 [Treponema vincentii ATCC 35580]|uniref:Uncharacterized protein n=1 Tax=Treponema vincentii ATCC 35580 TaxID=596324 RepID=C8PTV7_9SPIR|nr:hypothetical protein TREVI0001_0200 [Treponema vincentii ATCC 35580]